MRLEQLKSNLSTGEALGEQIAEGKKIAQRLAHLFAFNQQVGAVKPIFDEMLALRLQTCAFALGDFIFMMREHEVFAAEMEVEACAEEFHAHCATFDVPARASVAPGAWPCDHIVITCARFPEREIGH